MKPPTAPEECANCGGEIPRNARACPHCGADERTGWREASIYDGLDLPDDANEPAAYRRGPHSTGLPWYWILVVVVVLAALLLGALGLRL